MIPAPFYLARRYPSVAALNLALYADAQRWNECTVASIYADAFRQAARNAYAYRNRRHA